MRLRMQKDGEVCAHGNKAVIKHPLRRGACDDPVPIARRNVLAFFAQQGIAYGAADNEKFDVFSFIVVHERLDLEAFEIFSTKTGCRRLQGACRESF